MPLKKFLIIFLTGDYEQNKEEDKKSPSKEPHVDLGPVITIAKNMNADNKKISSVSMSSVIVAYSHGAFKDATSSSDVKNIISNL